MQEKPKAKRGFAAMSPEKAREIQRRGGQKSSSNFKHDRKRASELGRKGGLVSSVRKKS